jgi:hypothetical protein
MFSVFPREMSVLSNLDLRLLNVTLEKSNGSKEVKSLSGYVALRIPIKCAKIFRLVLSFRGPNGVVSNDLGDEDSMYESLELNLLFALTNTSFGVNLLVSLFSMMASNCLSTVLYNFLSDWTGLVVNKSQPPVI